MRKSDRLIFIIGSSVMLILYATPFFLLDTAKAHLMFIRLLITRQHWWAETMLYYRIGFTILAALLLVFVCIIKIKRRYYPLLCRINNGLSLLFVLIVLNIDPFITPLFYLMLHAAWIGVVISFLLTIITGVRIHRRVSQPVEINNF